MNRKERRAIKFGRAFNLTRYMYRMPSPAGIGLELEEMWAEYCRNQPDINCPLKYVWGVVNDWYTGE